MQDYLSITEAATHANNVHHCQYTSIKHKQIMFEADSNGKTFCMLTPQSKYLATQGRYWVDITSVQADFLDSYDKTFTLFRLEGMKLCCVKWSDIRPHMTAGYMTHNANEGDHWKLQICDDRIWIGKQENYLPVEIV